VLSRTRLRTTGYQGLCQLPNNAGRQREHADAASRR
jgi:hypothetical protein